MPVTELFLSAFIAALFERLTSPELLKLARHEGLRSKLKKLEKTLKMIEALLIDAEEKQLMGDRAVKMWLDDLRDWAYDAEDILDEFATEALGRKLKAEHTASSSNAQKYLPICFTALSPRAVSFSISMGSKIKDITRRLADLRNLRDDLSLKEIIGLTLSTAWQRPESTSVQMEPAIYGRDEDKAKILAMVLKDEHSDVNFRVIPIVGMGGLGKTTLARYVYSDKAMEDFKPRAWVCVSDDFDVLKISKAILESITSSSCNLNNLDQMQNRLKEAVAGKRFLLVLDDVWSQNYDLWESLRSPFMVGAPGSKIIVTTRNAEVALTMGSIGYYSLEPLSNDDCWSMFLKHAFENKNIGTFPDIDLLHQKVVEKCKGLPLAARTLGGLLRSEQRYEKWEHILSSRIWDLTKESDILPVLQLSYHQLPAHLKRCFAYCAIFPKDYEFKEMELVLLWMAEGLIQKSRYDQQLEDIGREYFHNLLSRSIFQPSSNDSMKFTMHDLVHDLAQYVSGDICLRLEDELEDNEQSKDFKRTRHSSYSSSHYDGKKNFEVFNKAERLRTFMPVRKWYYVGGSYITNMVICELLPKLKRLRVLSLEAYNIPDLPNSIGGLRHLRSLNLSRTNIKNLPDSINALLNLQILILKSCGCLSKLPSDMGNLVSLHHFDISDTRIVEMPLGMKQWKYIRTLSNFTVGKGTGSNLKDLSNLKLLSGELHISRLENTTTSEDMTKSILNDMKDLEVLVLEWGHSRRQFDESVDEIAEQNLLALLRPHRNLLELTIKFYGGREFSSWLGNPCFSNMVALTLEGCEKCRSLPSLGLLGSLKNLQIKRMVSIKRIGSEFFGEGCSKPFQSLETLYFDYLTEWECWEPVEENEQVEIFPRLRQLSIKFCSKLSGRLPNCLPSLEKLVIYFCEQLVIPFSSLPKLRELEINKCKEMVRSGPTISNWLRQGFQKLEHLRIGDCQELIDLLLNEICLRKQLRQMHGFTFLRKMHIQDLPNLVLFPVAGFLSILSELEIKRCNALKSLSEEMKDDNSRLEHLSIEDCNSLTFIFKRQFPSSLKSLSISACGKLELLLNDCTSPSSSSSSVMQKEIVDNTSKALLSSLHVDYCPSLTCLSSAGRLPPTLAHLSIWNCSSLPTLSSCGQLPAALTSLRIVNCSKLTTILSRGQLPESLKSLQIQWCPQLVSIAESFHHNRSLATLMIRQCGNLQSFPRGLHTLSNLSQFHISNCDSLVSFPEGGLPDTDLTFSIRYCEKLSTLPKQMNSLCSLQRLWISNCPSIISFSEEGFPTCLISLTIENLSIPLTDWGLHKFTSLRELRICECPDAESFPLEEMGMILPTSLTRLTIERFPNLRHLSSKGFQTLTTLEFFWLYDCPNLTSLPGLPSSLLELDIRNCPLLIKHCKRDKGRDWSKIADIPCVKIDYKFIYDPWVEEQEE